jgi:hypothetical protein
MHGEVGGHPCLHQIDIIRMIIEPPERDGLASSTMTLVPLKYMRMNEEGLRWECPWVSAETHKLECATAALARSTSTVAKGTAGDPSVAARTLGP